jgi:putative ABC transport system permease protein
MFQHPGVDLSIAFKALAILVVSGMLAGIVPAQRAVAIKPVDALRAD